MNFDSILLELSAIIVGAALLGTVFLYARQPIIIAYIAIGIIIGPSGLGLIRRPESIEQMAHLGVVLLLFIIGLNLQPGKLIKLFSKAIWLTFATSLLFASVSTGFAMLIGLDLASALIFGAAMMFSSTVVGLKLIPTTTLHHKHTGEVMTSVLLLQDILAIIVILFISGEQNQHVLATFVFIIIKLVALWFTAFMGVRYLIIPLLNKFDSVQEYTFVLTLAWCLFWAEAAHLLGLSFETGAFVAGLSIASRNVSLIVAENLKPLREFFLIMFFFAVGAKLDLQMSPGLLLAAMVFGAVLVPLKVWVFKYAFKRSGEKTRLSGELAVRLGQSSEFSLLVAFSALSAGLLTPEEMNVIQVATIVTFVISTYWVVLKYPTPISGSPVLRRD
ncbi:MAG TPA: sodium:proton antiporter [Gammaproteobacteria bacterium]|nr:sodium:proton antiporter [Gammaproteobacteria bacterium]